MTTTGATVSAGAKPVYSEPYKLLVLCLLVAAYAVNFIDRTIISTIGQPIKEDLKITDFQLGLLGGLYFALLYTFLGIPIARLAERFNRVNIITAAIVIWSGFTALCGTAANFTQLAAYRFGVGFGEAGLSPSAHSLISDYYEPKRRASALGIYSLGIPIGTMIGAIAGGWIALHFGWRMAFMMVGLPGILIAILIKLVIKEPPRGHSEPDAPPVSPEDVTVSASDRPFSMGTEFKELGAVAGTLLFKWPVANMVIGVTLASLGGYGSGAFVPPYFIRNFGLDVAQVGLITGIVGGVSSGLGTLLGGFVADRMSRRSARWYALTPAIGLAICTPIYVWAYLQPTWQAAALILLVPGIFHYTYLGPTFGVVQNMVETRRRATATALLFFILNLIALGGGPPLTGWIIDHMAQFNFMNGQHSIWESFIALFQGGGVGTDFATSCPGGVGAPGVAPAVAARCKVTLIEATRGGVIVTLFFYTWAAFHYLLGSIGLAKAMAKARADRGEV